MGYLLDAFMNHRRNQFLRSIHEVEAEVAGVWHTGAINQKLVEGDTLVITATFPTLDDQACTITASRIIDVRGEIAAYQQRTINKQKGQGVMIKITIPIYEVTA